MLRRCEKCPADIDEELLKQVEDELKKLKVSDLLVQMLYTVSSLGYRKLSAEDRDLEQAKLAIESLRALLPVLEGAVPEDVLTADGRPFGAYAPFRRAWETRPRRAILPAPARVR